MARRGRGTGGTLHFCRVFVSKARVSSLYVPLTPHLTCRRPKGGMERVNREDDKPSGNPSQTVPEGEEPTREASVRLGHKTLRTWMKNSSLW